MGRIQESTKIFSVPIEKEVPKVDNDAIESISYKIKCIDSARFMATSLSALANSLAEGIHKIKYKDCVCFLEYESIIEYSIKYKGTSWNKHYPNKINERLKKSGSLAHWSLSIYFVA